MQYGMIIDLDRCVGCHACAVACRAEWEIPIQFARNWLRRLGPANTPHGLAATYYPGLCNHCDKPSCVEACPADPVMITFRDANTGKTTTMEVAATWKDPFNGTVQIDKERCLGCGACADACPYGARYVNPDLADDESEGKADKCTYCMPRVAEGLAPACVQTCLAEARIFGDLSDPNSDVAKYVKKGAFGLTSKAVQIGPNSRYFGTKKGDLELIKAAAPQEMPEANLRRSMLATMMKPAMKSMSNITMVGLAGTLLVKSMEEDNDEKK
jgi:tetrathionate reductase subunit B